PHGTAALDRRAGHRPRARGARRRARHARHQRPRRGRSDPRRAQWRRPAPPARPVTGALGANDLTPDAPSGRAAAGLSLLRLLLRSGEGLLNSVSEIDMSRAAGPVLFTLAGVGG